MLKDYVCKNKECSLYDTKVERLVNSRNERSIVCQECKEPVEQVFAGTYLVTHHSWASWRIV